MEFGILGPLLVRDGSGTRFVHAGKQRILLASLLVRPEQTVPLETLADTLWDGQPPVSHVATMRNYVMRLRRSLGTAGYRVKTGLGGYRITLDTNEFDVLRFARLRAEGMAAYRAGAYGRAVRLLGDALAVWRGPVLADVPSELLRQQEAPPLDRMRLEAESMKAAAERMLGDAEGGGSGADVDTGIGVVPPTGRGRGGTFVREQGLELSVPTRQIHLRSLTYAGPSGHSRPWPCQALLEATPRPA
jgi:hypothetical protein